MPSVDIIDEVFLVADRATVRKAVCDEVRWAAWFPDLALSAYEDRGLDGVRWTLGGALTGRAEIWLEEFGDGTIVHTYVWAEPTRRRGTARSIARWATSRYALALKAHLLAIKDEIETERAVGTARVPPGERVVSPRIDSDDERVAGDGRPDDLKHPDPR